MEKAEKKLDLKLQKTGPRCACHMCEIYMDRSDPRIAVIVDNGDGRPFTFKRYCFPCSINFVTQVAKLEGGAR